MRLLLVAVVVAAPVAGVLAIVPEPGSRAPMDLPWLIGPDEGTPVEPRPPLNSGLREKGRSLYRRQCAICHGVKGDGAGTLAAQLTPAPTDFVRAVYKLRSTPAGTLPTDLDLFRTISRGLHGTAMQPWRALSERERWALVHQLKSFSPRFRQEPAASPLVVPLAPRESSELQDRGEALYVKFRCGACHGESGAGDGPAREKLRLAGNRDVRIRDFTRGRFIRGPEMEDIYLTLKVGIEGTPMAAYASLSDEELWALGAYVRLLIREHPLQDFPRARSLAGPGPAPAGAAGARSQTSSPPMPAR